MCRQFFRYETKPGLQAQVDRDECDRIEEDEHARRVYGQ